MSLLRLVGLAGALLVATACAEGASGPGTTSGGGAGQGGGPAGSGGAGQGGGTGGATVGAGGEGSGASPSTSSGGDGGDGGGAAPSSSSSTASDASSSAMSSTASGQADPGTIFFSEYIEGEGNNKALEIYNAGSTPIDLGNCHLERYQNGSQSALPDVALEDSMLASGDVFVICQSNFAQPGRCDRLTADIQHSGDDAVSLVCDGATKDIFGRIGEDAVWGTGLTSSENSTLRRKCSVLDGDTNGGDAFDPATQWDGFGLEMYDDLGVHDCP
jgi:hypothetical protein